jgi:hypothetical protein
MLFFFFSFNFLKKHKHEFFRVMLLNGVAIEVPELIADGLLLCAMALKCLRELLFIWSFTEPECSLLHH